LFFALGLSGSYDLALTEDSASFRPSSSETVGDLLATSLHGIRTFAYPLFLKGVQMVSPDLSDLPLCQFAVHVLAVVAFYLAVRPLVGSGRLALAVSSGLLYSNTILIDGRYLMSEALASSLAILAVAGLLAVVGRPRNLWAWGGLTLALFLAYQTRPAYLFLVPLVPVLGLLLLVLVSPREAWRRRRRRVGLGLTAAAFLPLLAFCFLRLALVGHFGLVAFNGYSLAGIASQLLTEEGVPELPEEVRPLAEAVLERQEVTEMDRTYPQYHDYDHERLRPGHPQGALYWLRGGLEESDNCYFWYDQFTWEVCDRAVGEGQLLGDKENSIARNEELWQLSLAVIKARPLAYAGHVAGHFGLAVLLTLFNSYSFLALWLLAFLLLATANIVHVWRRLWPGRAKPGLEAVPPPDYTSALHLMVLVTLTFTLGHLLLVALVAAPIFRYTDAAGVFLPTVPAVVLVALWEKVRAGNAPLLGPPLSQGTNGGATP
jgi:hypothetical protein